MPNKNYVVATIRPWGIDQYNKSIDSFPGSWQLITNPDDLTIERLLSINPRYVFFPHWNRKVPADLISKFECVCFHETNLPYGRGGSPIQNLIERGHKDTVVTALRMNDDFDSGPVYIRRPLSLIGLAEEIYIRSTEVVFDMIKDIVIKEPIPEPQTGNPTIFIRRVPEQSNITNKIHNLSELFDHIRMLDAEQYPHAFLRYGVFKIEFTRPAHRTGKIEATAKITILPREESINEDSL